jgi:hypothetical protein
MAAPVLKLETDAPSGMDRSIQRGRWSPTRWPIALKVAIAVAGVYRSRVFWTRGCS